MTRGPDPAAGAEPALTSVTPVAPSSSLGAHNTHTPWLRVEDPLLAPVADARTRLDPVGGTTGQVPTPPVLTGAQSPHTNTYTSTCELKKKKKTSR